MKKEILRICNGNKKLRNFYVLRDIHLEIAEGECIGIISDSQYARNILVDILCGNKCFDCADILYKEKKISFNQSQKLLCSKIYFMNPSARIAREFSVEDVLFAMNREKAISFRLIGKLCKDINRIFQEFNLPLSQKDKIINLSILERCQLELINAYVNGYSVIVITDLSHLLSDYDRDEFMKLVRQLRMKGMAFFVIDNSEESLFEYTDRICVLRQGTTNYMLEPEEFDTSTLNILLRGCLDSWDPGNSSNKRKGQNSHPKEVLKLSHVSAGMLHEVSFSIHSGEITSLVCPDSYQGKDIMNLLKGYTAEYEGKIYFNGQVYSPVDARQGGEMKICYIEENPIEPGKLLFYNMNVLDNLSLIMLSKMNKHIIRKCYEKSIQKESKEFLGEDIFQKQVSELTDVEKQKLAYFKWYLYNPDLIVCNQPFVGTDIYTKQVTKEMIYKYAKKNIAVLAITSNINMAKEIGGNTIIIKKI